MAEAADVAACDDEASVELSEAHAVSITSARPLTKPMIITGNLRAGTLSADSGLRCSERGLWGGLGMAPD